MDREFFLVTKLNIDGKINESLICWQKIFDFRSVTILHSIAHAVPPPSVPTITMAVSHSPTSITLTWTQPEWEVVDSYEVSFSYQGPCSGFSHTNTTTVAGTTRQYTLTGLQDFSNYTVTVVAVNGAGRSGGNNVNVVTMADGTYACQCQNIQSINTLKSYTILLSPCK